MSQQLTIQIINHGVENIRFYVPMERIIFSSPWFKLSNGEPDNIVECTIDESRYRVADNYKITLKPVGQNYASQHFYINDLYSLMKRSPECFRMVKI